MSKNTSSPPATDPVVAPDISGGPVLDTPAADLTDAVRSHLLEFLRGGSAHVDPATALAGVAEKHYGAKPAGSPHSPWQLLEHLRFTLHDLLEFCTNPDYAAPAWPDDYWPGSEAPGEPTAWQSSTESFLGDLSAFEAMAEDPKTDLYAKIPWGQGQTILRELLLVIDHTSYHLGQLVLLRKQLEDWKE
jgi:hypothetical protein